MLITPLLICDIDQSTTSACVWYRLRVTGNILSCGEDIICFPCGSVIGLYVERQYAWSINGRQYCMRVKYDALEKTAGYCSKYSLTPLQLVIISDRNRGSIIIEATMVKI